MKILDRYVLRAFWSALFATVIFMIGLYLVIHFLTHLGYLDDAARGFAASGYGLVTGICTYYAVHLPEVLVLFGPYAILFAAMYAMHQLDQNNELVPMYAVGVSRLRAVAPVFLAAAVLSAGLVVVKEEVVPSLARDMVMMSRLLRGKDEPIYDELDLLRDGKGNVYFAEAWDGGKKRLVGIHMQRPGTTSTWSFDWLQWLEDDSGHGWFAPPPGQAPAGFDFRRDADLEPFDIIAEQRIVRRLSFRELKEIVDRHPDRGNLAVTMHGHVTYAFTAIVLLLLGLPLMMRGRGRSVFAGVGLCLVLSLGFFSATQILQRLGAQGEVLDPLLGAWLPVIVFGAFGLVLFEATR